MHFACCSEKTVAKKGSYANCSEHISAAAIKKSVFASCHLEISTAEIKKPAKNRSGNLKWKHAKNSTTCVVPLENSSQDDLQTLIQYNSGWNKDLQQCTNMAKILTNCQCQMVNSVMLSSPLYDVHQPSMSNNQEDIEDQPDPECTQVYMPKLDTQICANKSSVNMSNIYSSYFSFFLLLSVVQVD
jgi:hypothetical protein